MVVEGIAELANDRGFTFTMYQSGNSLHISEGPAAGLFNPLDVLSCFVDTVPIVC